MEGLQVTLQIKNQTSNFTIEKIKQLKNRIGLKFKEINDEETALSWKGADVLVDKENLEPLEKSEFYHFEIEGSSVYDENDELIGKVKYVENNAANDILIIDGKDKEIMIPFVKAIVKEVDLKNKKIKIKKVDGLY
jgi:16S rRNA processing protein RimM